MSAFPTGVNYQFKMEVKLWKQSQANKTTVHNEAVAHTTYFRLDKEKELFGDTLVILEALPL